MVSAVWARARAVSGESEPRAAREVVSERRAAVVGVREARRRAPPALVRGFVGMAAIGRLDIGRGVRAGTGAGAGVAGGVVGGRRWGSGGSASARKRSTAATRSAQNAPMSAACAPSSGAAPSTGGRVLDRRGLSRWRSGARQRRQRRRHRRRAARARERRGGGLARADGRAEKYLSEPMREIGAQRRAARGVVEQLRRVHLETAPRARGARARPRQHAAVSGGAHTPTRARAASRGARRRAARGARGARRAR